MPRKRDYQAEYSRRIETSMAAGKTRAEARGHPAKIAPRYDERVAEAVGLMREGRSKTQAAREAHVAPERLSALMRGGLGEQPRPGTRWKLTTYTYNPTITIFEQGNPTPVQIEATHDTAVHVGHYLNDVKQAVKYKDDSYLDDYMDDVVSDVDGNSYILETDLDVLYDMDVEDEDVYAEGYTA